MRKSSNKGFILLESMLAFSVLTTCIFIFLHLQSASLQQSAHLQEKAEILRVLYEEVQYQQTALPANVSYKTIRKDMYQVTFWQSNQQQQVQINKGDSQVVIKSEN
ncbi:competence type IV pilus minor pilin ComGE [Enterococcus sp.]|uniref:competence type IV pilus minor pilin ComGE n=1 Tax=Enterococcus sp. TaxID=35783 RepID=UPI0028ACB0F8|nr:competence type IV pilus minor pilin ComGE [Enterococcus sp.]